MNKVFRFLFLIIASSTMWSCYSTKDNLAYFENADSLLVSGATIGNNNYGMTIVPEDELKIIIHSEVPEAVAMYNLPLASVVDSRETKTTSTQSILTFTVDKHGYVTLPVIGKLYVMGKTLEEVENMVRAEVSKQVNNPYVSVKLWNFRVNVLGEVNVPGVKWANKERYSILDAIGDAGDLTQYGKRDNVMLIREENGTKRIYRFNLNDVKMLESPYFYLRQNDVVVVEPNDIKKENSKYNQYNGYRLSVVSTVVGVASVIASLVIALFVK